VSAVEMAEPAGSATLEPQAGMLSALRVRDFRLLWIGQSISFLGDQFHFVALAWLTLLLTGSPLALGTVLMAGAVPRAVLMLVGGAMTDRWPQRVLMLLSDALRAVLVTGLATLVLTGNARLWQLYVLAVIFGTVDAVFFPATQAIVPSLVDEHRLTGATALMQTASQVSNLLGPVAAGGMIALIAGLRGIGLALAVDAATFYVSTLALLLMRSRGGTTAHDEAKEGNILQSIREGLLYAWNDRVLRALLIAIAGIDMTANGVVGVGFPLLGREHFGGSAGFGVMVSGFGAGALLGIVAAGTIKKPRRRGLIATGVVFVFAVGFALLPFAPNLIVAAALVAVMGAGSGFINVLVFPWIQTRTDQAMLGRIFSLIMLASVGLTPLSYAVAGWIADISLTSLFLAGSVVILATATYTALSPARTID
jgi:MFS family permease